MRRFFATLALTFIASAAFAADDINLKDGVAVSGYDVVAYFTDGKPVEGDARFAAKINGATYRFASAEHLALFNQDPQKYLPEFGGYCAYGAAQGHKAPIDPAAWSIVDGKLYLNYNLNVRTRFQDKPKAYIDVAQHNWSLIGGLSKAELEKNVPQGVREGL